MEIRSWLTGTRGVSLPFTDECAPILPDDIRFADVVSQVISHGKARDWKTLEFRGRIPGMENLPASVEYLAHELDLTPGEEVLFSRFRSNVQRNIRKAEREGVSIDRDASPANLCEYYRLNCLTRKDHGLPPQPFRFFENLLRHVLADGKGTLLLARYRQQFIAGAVFLHNGRGVIYKYGASDKRFQHLRANNLLMWEAIRSYGRKGFKNFSFGRTDMEHEGLRQFKLSWGSTEKSLRYSRFDLISGSWQVKKKPRNIYWNGVFARLPVPLLRVIGTLGYSHKG
jgi:hypothetical protein